MPDFLTSIAARALGTIPVVTPRPIARFEPDSGRNESWSEQRSEKDVSAEAPRTELRSTADARSPVFPTRSGSDTPSPPSGGDSPGQQKRSEAPVVRSLSTKEADVGAAARPDAGTKPALTTRREVTKRGSLEARAGIQQTQRLSSSSRKEMQRPERVESAPGIHISIGRVDVRAIHRADKPAPSRVVPEAPRTSLGAYLRSRRD